MELLFVGGTFDLDGGKDSGIVQRMHDEFSILGMNVTLFNGGNYNNLDKIIAAEKEYDAVLWMPNVPNNLEKLTEKIKSRHRTSVFVSSKRVHNNFSTFDVVQHSLRTRSNVVIEFSKAESLDSKFRFRVLDPFGNLFLDYSTDIEELCWVIFERVRQLYTYVTRINSYQVGEAFEIPNEEAFFEIVRKFADNFNCLFEKEFPGAHQVRYLGNASFRNGVVDRCLSGFTSFKDDSYIYMSKRNLNKSLISKDGFVALNPGVLPVEFYGPHKPSVDAPVQVSLFDFYPKIKYIVHGHFYVEEAPMLTKEIDGGTPMVMPCGAIEEADEIMDTFPDSETTEIVINLKGHGFVAMAQNLDFFDQIALVPRQFPERIDLNSNTGSHWTS